MTTFKTPGTATTSMSHLAKATSIFEYTHVSATALVSAFDDAKKKRCNAIALPPCTSLHDIHTERIT